MNNVITQAQKMLRHAGDDETLKGDLQRIINLATDYKEPSRQPLLDAARKVEAHCNRRYLELEGDELRQAVLEVFEC